MTGVKVHIEGLPIFRRNIERLASRFSDRQLGNLLEEVSNRVTVPAIQAEVEAQGLIDEGNLINSFRVRRGRGVSVTIENNQPYAAIHEFGGVTHPTVTAAMRAWAWGMYFETGDEMYKGIALTRKAKLTVPIPARPYFRPGVENARTEAAAYIRIALLKELRF